MFKRTTNEFSFRLRPSSIDGVGVFAVHGIAKGVKLLIKPDGYRSRQLRKKDVPKAFRGFLVPDEDGVHYRSPNAFNHMWFCWFLNHSATPNAQGDENDNFNYYTTRPIQAGEEITIDYHR